MGDQRVRGGGGHGDRGIAGVGLGYRGTAERGKGILFRLFLFIYLYYVYMTR